MDFRTCIVGGVVKGEVKGVGLALGKLWQRRSMILLSVGVLMMGNCSRPQNLCMSQYNTCMHTVVQGFTQNWLEMLLATHIDAHAHTCMHMHADIHIDAGKKLHSILAGLDLCTEQVQQSG